MDTLQDYIWGKQYALNKDELYVPDGIGRVASVVANGDEELEADFYELMLTNKFIPGGRVLAGAGSAHGNMLNCFVLDGSPHNIDKEPTAYTMALASKLAQVTKVGGGTGIYLGGYDPKSPYFSRVGSVQLTIDEGHADYYNVANGIITNTVTGKQELKGYKNITFARPTSKDEAQNYIVPNDSVISIFKAASHMVKYMLNGRNCTIDLSKLRPEGAEVKGSGGVSSGPASFAVEIFDNFAKWASLGGGVNAGPVATLRYVFAPTLRVIRQGGTRRGAGMATLDINHADILDFVTAKTLKREENEGDISTFNISVLVPDSYYERDNGEVVSAIFEIAKQAWATGEPGVIFVDTVNKNNPLADKLGPIKATNPCGEIPLYPGEPCDLGAINLAEFVNGKHFDYVGFSRTVTLAVRFLDNVLSLEKAPLLEIRNAIDNNRRIGLGVMGLADMLVKLRLKYSSKEGRDLVARVMDVMASAAASASKDLGREFGVPENLKELNRRNVAVLTVAPTGTTSMLAGVSSGIEPIFAASYTRRIGTEYKEVLHPLFYTMLAENYSESFLQKAYKTDNPLIYIDNAGNKKWNIDMIIEALKHTHGSVTPLVDKGLLPLEFYTFEVAHDIDPSDHVRMQTTIQQVFDNPDYGKIGNSISKTINLPNDATELDVQNAFYVAWNNSAKGCTVYRDGSRNYQVLSVGDKAQSFEEWLEAVRGYLVNDTLGQEAQTSLVEAVVSAQHVPQTVKREQVVFGFTHKLAVGGKKLYVTVNQNTAGQPVEAFIRINRPTPDEAVTTDIVGRLLSTALKYGAPIEELAKHLKGHYDTTGGLAEGKGFVQSRWDVIAEALLADVQPFDGQLETPNVPETGVLCPNCEEASLVRKGGCNKCPKCNYEACG